MREILPEDEKITEVAALQHHDIPGRFRISYRICGDKQNFGRFEYEHQVYYSAVEDRIDRLRRPGSGLFDPEK